MMDMKGVVPLLCPECGRELDGLDTDVIFFCNQCHTGHECSAKGLRSYPVRYAVHDIESTKPDIYLPFWSIDIALTFGISDNAVQRAGGSETRAAKNNRTLLDKASRTIGQWKTAIVPAMRMFRASYYGDPGLIHSTNQFEIPTVRPEVPEPGFKLLGGARRITDAIRYPELYALLVLDRNEDVTNLDLKITHNHAFILGLPYAVVGNRAVDCILQKDFPDILFSDWALLLGHIL